ncbi:VF530 family DNA-binding protein [Psychromonas sp.]|uniref:VF530 family DNA-binding protein n=1 Tax=Psychromonas sp. TaxID=1884585 RepID=UPI0035689759
MTDKKTHNPLYGLKMDLLLTQISDFYGWELLSETLNIERFLYHTGMKSTVKFLRNNQWAKEKVENFYLYHYKNLPYPDDKQLSIAPRDRFIPADQNVGEPAEITKQSSAQIEHAAKLRNYQSANSGNKGKNKSAERNEEPPYDPGNPWNI